MGKRITIVAIGDLAEGLALRAMLESMTYEVRLLPVGVPKEVAATLMRAREDDVVILSAHGSAQGLYMGAFGDGVDTAMMKGDWLPVTEAFKGVTFRPDAVLISTACATRQSGLVQVMLNAGGHLIAPDGYPDGHVIVPWIGACLLGAENGLAAAVEGANTLVSAQNRFSYG